MRRSLSFLYITAFIMGMSIFVLNCSPNKMSGGKSLTEEDNNSGDLNNLKCDEDGTCTRAVASCDSDGSNCTTIIESCDANGENCTDIQTCDANGENCTDIEDSESDCDGDSCVVEDPVETVELNLGSCKFLDKDQTSSVLVSPDKDSSIKFDTQTDYTSNGYGSDDQEQRAFKGLIFLAKANEAIDLSQYILDSDQNPKCTVLSKESCSFDFTIYTSGTSKDCHTYKADGTCQSRLKQNVVSAGLTRTPKLDGGWIPRNFVATIDKGAVADGSACTLTVKYLGSDARVDAGCFDPETKIRSINNKEIPIKLLTKADKVFNPLTKKFMEIKKIVKGPEALPLVEVSVKGKVIKVSSTHAMITKSGVKIAMDLSLNDEIALEDGKAFNKIESIKLLPVDKDQKVINLELKSDSKKPEDHAVLANGMVSGDLFLQVQKEKELKLLDKNGVNKKVEKDKKDKEVKEEKMEQSTKK